MLFVKCCWLNLGMPGHQEIPGSPAMAVWYFNFLLSKYDVFSYMRFLHILCVASRQVNVLQTTQIGLN